MAGPGGVSSGLKLWLEADGTLWQNAARTTPATADGDPVGGWDDASGLGQNATQNPGNMPVLKTGIVNAKPVVRFDGATSYIVSANDTGVKPVTLFAVVRLAAISGTYSLQGAGGFGGLQYRVSAAKQQLLEQAVTVIGSSTTSLSASTFYILAASYTTGGAYAFYLNGTPDGSGTNSQSIFTGNSQIGRNGAGGEFLNGDLAEFIAYNALLVASDMDLVGNYLATKYGLTWNNIAAPGVALAGSSAGASTVSAALGAAFAVAAESDGGSTVSAALGAIRAIAAGSAGASTASATAALSAALAGLSPGQSTVAADLKAALALAGAINGDASAAAAAGVLFRLAGESDATSTARLITVLQVLVEPFQAVLSSGGAQSAVILDGTQKATLTNDGVQAAEV